MRAIIFDFGRVIGDFDHFITLNKVQPFTKLSPQEMFRRVYESDLEDTFERGKLEVDAFLDRVVQCWELTCDHVLLRGAVADIFSPNPEVCDLIPRLAGRYRLILGSNTNPLHSEHFLSQFSETLGHFNHLVLSHLIGHRKPDPEFFHHCVAQAGCAANDCVFVDDIAANIAGAEAVGLHGVLYRPGNGLVDQLQKHGITI